MLPWLILTLGLLGTVQPALAQAVDETGTGGGPRSTITAPYTTSDGTTKPRGDALGPETRREREEERRIERQDDRIDSGICVGCGR